MSNASNTSRNVMRNAYSCIALPPHLYLRFLTAYIITPTSTRTIIAIGAQFFKLLKSVHSVLLVLAEVSSFPLVSKWPTLKSLILNSFCKFLLYFLWIILLPFPNLKTPLDSHTFSMRIKGGFFMSYYLSSLHNMLNSLFN